MYENRFRDRVVRSEFTLPTVLAVSLVIWLALGSCVADFADIAVGCAVACLTGYVVMEWANANALLRIRSRLITACFLLLLTVLPFLHAWDTGFLTLLCVALSYVFLFQTYQRYDSAAAVFHTFFFLGVASVFYRQALYLALPMLISLFSQLRSLTLRNFAAGVIGLLTPYWLLFAYAAWEGETGELLAGLLESFRWSAPDYSGLSVPQMVSAGFVVFYAFIATCHFVRTAFNDKIRTRMYYYALILQEVFLLAILLLFPGQFNATLRLLILCASPLIAHYFALSRGRMMNLWFVLSLFALVLLSTYNYYSLWML